MSERTRRRERKRGVPRFSKNNKELQITILGASKQRKMERDVEIYLEDQYLNTFFEDRIQKIVVHPLKPENWPARCEAIPDHPHSLDSGIIEEYLSDSTLTPQSNHSNHLEDIADQLLSSLETEEPADEDDTDLLEHIMVMADCVDQSIQTLRGQLNLIIFNLRTEPASRDKYEKILEMMKNLQYLRITVNRSVRSQSHKNIAHKDAFTQVQPRHRHVGLQCHMKEKSTFTKMIKSVKKVSTDPERLRKSSKAALNSAIDKTELIVPGTPKRIKSFGKGTKKVFNNIKSKI